MGFDPSNPSSFLQEARETPRRRAISRASCGLPRSDCATEMTTGPGCLCSRSEPAARWCCRGGSAGGRGEGRCKSWCRCRCRPRLPGGNPLLPGHWVLGHPGRRWILHRPPFRTICRCRCGPRWKLCWTGCYCWSDRSKGHPTARGKTEMTKQTKSI